MQFGARTLGLHRVAAARGADPPGARWHTGRRSAARAAGPSGSTPSSSPESALCTCRWVGKAATSASASARPHCGRIRVTFGPIWIPAPTSPKALCALEQLYLGSGPAAGQRRRQPADTPTGHQYTLTHGTRFHSRDAARARPQQRRVFPARRGGLSTVPMACRTLPRLRPMIRSVPAPRLRRTGNCRGSEQHVVEQRHRQPRLQTAPPCPPAPPRRAPGAARHPRYRGGRPGQHVHGLRGAPRQSVHRSAPRCECRTGGCRAGACGRSVAASAPRRCPPVTTAKGPVAAASSKLAWASPTTGTCATSRRARTPGSPKQATSTASGRPDAATNASQASSTACAPTA